MSKYIWLGLLLAFSFTVFFIRFTQPELFHSNTKSNIISGFEVGSSPTDSDGKKIQVALILDTSNSMDGLLDQAKSQLWKLVNELTTYKKNGETPDIEIALFQFGNQDINIFNGYIEQIMPLSMDFDLLSEHLFSLKTNGGNEYCAWAIKEALQNLEWSKHPKDLKMIFIAGNEPFNQGPEDYTSICKAAKKAGIIVNTIHCGDYFKGKFDLWEDGANLAGGKYLNIDHNDQVVHTSTPYDESIIQLNKALNTTYISYGEGGAAKSQNQAVQDANASRYSSANVRTRAFVKSKKTYKNESWDLVDFTASHALAEVKEAELPQEMRRMNDEEKLAYIEAKRKERENIQKQLKEYEELVRDYVSKNAAELAKKQTLDNAMLEIIQEQARDKGFLK